MNPLEAFEASKKLNIKMNRPSAHNMTQDETPNPKPQAPQQTAPEQDRQTPSQVVQNTNNHTQNQTLSDTNTSNATDEHPINDIADSATQSQKTAPPQNEPVMNPKPAAPPKAKPDVVPVDVSIAGTHHRIVCPVGEVRHLEMAAAYINEKLRSIRQSIKGKLPSNEELLVLTCLEMYDQISTLQNNEDYYTTERDEALLLIDGMLKNAKASL
ncbi:cell division protein ZapA [Moraxella sp. VT-16-12]|uniref:cell division protein ZapA n=1 Tax=Moraxella sp. VT-16-12 TaxID=2014877 RepID=UPI000B7DADD9|nr:cell division protein ZapA [Moraxella sp. VT-16-12]TWV83067.1 cell division protein ZapA [Moraxella sp. VT-16-12]